MGAGLAPLDGDLPSAAGLSLERYGGVMTEAAGSTRKSLSTRMTATNDRRSIGRTKIAKNALLFFSVQTGVRPCAVTDITNVGACIHMRGLPVLPLNF